MTKKIKVSNASKVDPREFYWNENYANYWLSRADELANSPSKLIPEDTGVAGIDLYGSLFADFPPNAGRILDVGCGWGRLFPLWADHSLRVSGLDISSQMIELAGSRWGSSKWVEVLEHGVAEELPYDDETFDNVACVATFDACRQHEALAEFSRVTRPGGRIFVTGKNSSYLADDNLALQAEFKAREKGHPNFFTDTERMIERTNSAGTELVGSRFFARRGDFGRGQSLTNRPKLFYEYFLVFRRGTRAVSLEPFSSPVSRTFQEQWVSDEH